MRPTRATAYKNGVQNGFRVMFLAVRTLPCPLKVHTYELGITHACIAEISIRDINFKGFQIRVRT